MRKRHYDINKNVDDINKSIYCNANKYGYKLNVNNPQISEYYKRFKKWKGLATNAPLSDDLRFEFERYMLDVLRKNKKQDIPPA